MGDSGSEDESFNKNWVVVDSVDLAEDALNLSDDSLLKSLDTESESDGISVISESSHQEACEGEKPPEIAGASTDVVEAEISEAAAEGDAENKWSYAEDKGGAPEASKQFYLNCNEEPVQELTETELGACQSDTDSDSISVISDPTDEDEGRHYHYQDMEKNNWLDFVRNYMTQLDNTKMLVGTIIFAAVSMMCAQHLTSPDALDDTLSSDQFADKLDPKADYYSMLDPVEYCKERHGKDDRFVEVKIKKCLKNVHSHNEKLKEKLRQDQKDLIRKYNENKNKTFYVSCLHKRNNLKVKEEFLRAKEKFLIQKEYELIKTELKLLKEANLLKSKYENRNFTNNNSTNNHFDKEDLKKYKNERKLFKFSKKFDQRKHFDNSKLNKKEKVKEKKFKYVKKYKNYKKDLYQDKKYKYDDNKSTKGDKDDKNDFIMINKKNEKNNTLSGLWYTKMHKSRNDLRKNPCDWMNCSKFKRNRHNWYIKLMQNRETLRYK